MPFIHLRSRSLTVIYLSHLKILKLNIFSGNKSWIIDAKFNSQYSRIDIAMSITKRSSISYIVNLAAHSLKRTGIFLKLFVPCYPLRLRLRPRDWWRQAGSVIMTGRKNEILFSVIKRFTTFYWLPALLKSQMWKLWRFSHKLEQSNSFGNFL